MPHIPGVLSVVVLKVNQPAELSPEDMAMPKRGLDLQHALSKTTQTKMHFMAIGCKKPHPMQLAGAV